MRIFDKEHIRPFFALIGLFVGICSFVLFDDRLVAHEIWMGTLIIGGLPIVWQTARGMARGIFASDIVAMMAIITAVLVDQPFAGAVVVLMQSGGEAIEAYGFKRASSSLRGLLERAPKRARRKGDGRFDEVDVSEVRVGDILLVRPGDFIPVDGTIMGGEAEIDESALTGEPIPRGKKAGDRVLSGSIDLNGALEMRADRLSSESQYAKIVALVKKAQEEKAPIQRLADRYAVLFTPLTLLMCALGYWITRDTTAVLAVLVVATPCPLILATPLAVMCGINRAADAGIIVKGGSAIEQVASIQAALFDKTGTITFGEPLVDAVVPLNGESADRVLYHAAVLEQYSAHCIAKSIVKRGLESHEVLGTPSDFHETPGRGVSGKIDGEVYLVGSSSFVSEQTGIDWMERFGAEVDRIYSQDKVLILVAKGRDLLGFIVLSDRIRPAAPAMIQQLRMLGVKEIAMLTGDSRKNAEVIAHLAGIGQVEAELLPEEKVGFVEKMGQRYFPVMMVGDGINDAPALATATVGMAMGASGTAVSAEAADIVILFDDLSKVAEAISIGRRMLYIAKQSIGIGIGLSFVLMCVAASGMVPPAIGAMLQEVIDVAVILNALRARE